MVVTGSALVFHPGDLRVTGECPAWPAGECPGGSNPKAARPCCYVYVVDLVRFEMGLLIHVGTSRLSHNLFNIHLFILKFKIFSSFYTKNRLFIC